MLMKEDGLKFDPKANSSTHRAIVLLGARFNLLERLQSRF